MTELCITCNTPIEKNATVCNSCGGALHQECAIKCPECGEAICDTCFMAYGKCKEHKEKEKKEIEFEFIRRSHIELYKACPFQFYLEVIKGVENKQSTYAHVGCDVHTIAETWNGESFEDILERWKKMFSLIPKEEFAYDAQTYQKKLNAIEFENAMYETGVNSLANLIPILNSIPPAFLKEKNLKFSVGADMPLVSITMDRVNINKQGNLEIHDWKTGKVMIGKKLETDLQAPLYIKAVQENYSQQVDSFTFHYLAEGKTRVFKRVNDDEYVCTVGKRKYTISITEAIREVKSIFSRIKNGEFNVPKKPSYFACKMCHYKQIEACAGADIQGWKQAWK